MSIDGIIERIEIGDVSCRIAALGCLAGEERVDAALVLAVLAIGDDLDAIRQAIDELRRMEMRVSVREA